MSDKPHVWIVGFPRCGSASLCAALRILGWNPIHNPRHWDQLEGHDAAGDVFVTAHYRELSTIYPDSLCILNTRNVEEWLVSLERIPLFWRSRMAYDRYYRLVVYGGDRPDRRTLRVAWDIHHAEVRGFIPPDRLLEMEPPFAWEPLCGFLGVPPPGGPFPWLNRGSCADVQIRLGGR